MGCSGAACRAAAFAVVAASLGACLRVGELQPKKPYVLITPPPSTVTAPASEPLRISGALIDAADAAPVSVTLREGDQSVTTVSLSADGDFTLDWPVPQDEALIEHVLSVTAVDARGRELEQAAVFSVFVATETPSAPTLSAAPSLTRNDAVQLRVDAAVGVTVRLTVGDRELTLPGGAQVLALDGLVVAEAQSVSAVAVAPNGRASAPGTLVVQPGLVHVRAGAVAGDADGSASRPFASMTAALEALGEVPAPFTLRVAAGTYDSSSGERFPIVVTQGRTLSGEVDAAGASLVQVNGAGVFTDDNRGADGSVQPIVACATLLVRGREDLSAADEVGSATVEHLLLDTAGFSSPECVPLNGLAIGHVNATARHLVIRSDSHGVYFFGRNAPTFPVLEDSTVDAATFGIGSLGHDLYPRLRDVDISAGTGSCLLFDDTADGASGASFTSEDSYARVEGVRLNGCPQPALGIRGAVAVLVAASPARRSELNLPASVSAALARGLFVDQRVVPAQVIVCGTTFNLPGAGSLGGEAVLFESDSRLVLGQSVPGAAAGVSAACQRDPAVAINVGHPRLNGIVLRGNASLQMADTDVRMTVSKDALTQRSSGVRWDTCNASPGCAVPCQSELVRSRVSGFQVNLDGRTHSCRPRAVSFTDSCTDPFSDAALPEQVTTALGFPAAPASLQDGGYSGAAASAVTGINYYFSGHPDPGVADTLSLGFTGAVPTSCPP